MRWSDIPIDPPRRTLRTFASLALVVFGGLSVYHGVVRDRTTLAVAMAALALAIGPIGLIRPRAIRPVYLAAMALSLPIGWVVSRLILLAIFLGLFTPVALVFRLIGRDALDRPLRPDAPTYWEPKPPPPGARSYFRQF